MSTSATGDTTPASSGSRSARPKFSRPDEFTASLADFFDNLADHSRAVIAVLVLLFLIGVGATYYANHREGISDEARSALFDAQESLQKELTTYAGTLPPEAPPAPPATAKGKGAKAAAKPQPVPRTAESVRFTHFDVDAKLPDTVKKLEAVASKYGNTRAGYEARMALGGLYADHGEGAQAVEWLSKAVEAAPGGTERTLANYDLGYAQEIAGKPADAAKSFQAALSAGDAGIKGEILLALARNQQLAQQTAQAKATYDKIISDLPNSEYARTAEVLRAKLQ
jgi:TolA-binding protein